MIRNSQGSAVRIHVSMRAAAARGTSELGIRTVRAQRSRQVVPIGAQARMSEAGAYGRVSSLAGVCPQFDDQRMELVR